MRKFSSGFSLIELLIVMTIFTVITLVAITRHSSFNSTTLLNNLSYEVALSIRLAQSYGVSVRSTNSANPFSSGYGVYFNENSNNSYILFQDLNKDNAYSGGGELVDTYTLKHGHTIADACAGGTCFASQAGNQVLNIVFRRPKPDAIVNGSQQFNASIVLTSGQSQRTVQVLTTGQIAITNP